VSRPSDRPPTSIEIDHRRIGVDEPPYVIAEMSANHLGELDRAFAIVEAAAAAGADALKLQTYTADSMTLASDERGFRIEDGPWKGRSLHGLYEEAHTPWEWHEALFARGRALGMQVFSSPFDEAAIDLLERLGAPAYKIASFELVDHDLIARAAATGKPLIISTGMATDEEIDEAVAVAREHGSGGVAVLHCISGYPTPPEEFNLRRVDRLRRHGVVGISDHSPGSTIPIAAVARGACIVEKHLTLRRADGGPDAAFSLEPAELAEVVAGCRAAWHALGDGKPRQAPSEASSRALRRSLFVVADVAAGEPFTRANVRAIRPGLGLAPKHLGSVLGRRALGPVKRGTPLSWELLT
jgi:pseudaminic acid synthase